LNGAPKTPIGSESGLIELHEARFGGIENCLCS
jgi:hypothetical protein